MKHIFLSVLLLCAAAHSKACTVCGCTAGNQYLGILPQVGSHFAGLQYQYREFTSRHPDEADNAFSSEYYHTMQVWGKANIGKRLRLFAFVPYVANYRKESHGTVHTSGLGDITALANIQLLDRENKKQWMQNLQAGGGIKLPTGKNDASAITEEGGLPNMQPGTGSWDIVANANYTVRHQQVGANLDASYTLTTPNRHGYKYGNRLSTGLLAFYWRQLERFSLMPQAGCRWDLAGTDYDNYAKGNTSDMTGGSQLYGVVGVQVYYKQLGFQASVYKPLAQHYADGLVKNKFKTEAGLYLLF